MSSAGGEHQRVVCPILFILQVRNWVRSPERGRGTPDCNNNMLSVGKHLAFVTKKLVGHHATHCTCPGRFHSADPQDCTLG